MEVPTGWFQGVAKRAANQACPQGRHQKNSAEVRQAEPETHPGFRLTAWTGLKILNTVMKTTNTEAPKNTGVLNVFKLLETSISP